MLKKKKKKKGGYQKLKIPETRHPSTHSSIQTYKRNPCFVVPSPNLFGGDKNSFLKLWKSESLTKNNKQTHTQTNKQEQNKTKQKQKQKQKKLYLLYTFTLFTNTKFWKKVQATNSLVNL